MQTFFKFFLIVFSSFILSCSGSQTHKVAFLYPDDSFIRFVNEGDFMAEALAEKGIHTIKKNAEDNDVLQLRQGYELLNEGVDVLVVVAVNGNTIAPLIRDAKRQGVKVIAYNRLINNADYDLFFTGNNEDIARSFCEAALSQSPTGNYVVLAGDRFDRNGFEVKQYIDEILEPHIASGKINLLFSSYVEGWNQKRAAYEMQQVIDAYGLDIDAVIACSDPMAMGVLEVLKKYDLDGKVILTGQDAILEAVKSIYKGEMYLTVYHPHRALGYKVAEIIEMMLDGRDPKSIANWTTFNGTVDIPTYRMSSVAVTKNDIEKELINTGQYTWSDIR